ARHVRAALGPDGTWMIVEPRAGDRVEDNLNPVGRAYYAFSTLLCTPSSLSQEGGLALGAQAGFVRLTEVLKTAGFSRVRLAAETPFNLVIEARP
ncbi:MAG TPA: SAM-dependent methyltransferase, partial [Solirubrobacteraceae bacterium]